MDQDQGGVLESWLWRVYPLGFGVDIRPPGTFLEEFRARL